MQTPIIRVQINGEKHELPSSLTLLELVRTFQVDPKSVVVEQNRRVVARDELDQVAVSPGDEIEIVHFVGGGKAGQPAESAGRPPGTRQSARAKTGAKTGAKNLVIVESPTKARTLTKFLGPAYQVEASMGHVRDLPKSKMGIDLKSNNFQPDYVIIPRSKKTVARIKKEAKDKEGIYLAPDPDREGEAISWHLAAILKEVTNGQVQRVVFNEITPEAVRAAFKTPREIDERLVNAQQARRVLDRIVGYELSPLLWKKVGKGLSAGRVQSVALRLIVEREREIRNFVPKEYWQIVARLSSTKGKEPDKIFSAKFERIGEKKTEIPNQAEAEKLKQAIEKLPFLIERVEKKERRRRPQAPYTTSRLQQESYTRLGFTAAKTMMLAQRLYEGKELQDGEAVGLITYMRTDSVNVAKGAQAEAAKWVQEKYGKEYLPEEPPVYKSKKGAQEAHEAVRPSSVFRTPEKVKDFLEEDEFLLYELIWKKFVASQMVPAVDEQTTVSIVAGGKYFFRANGRRNLFPGFAVVFEAPKNPEPESSGPETGAEKEEPEEEGTQELPELKEGDPLQLHELLPTQHFTKPPARYNDASLVRILEEKGIGRPSTYAPTLYTLLDREYVERKGGAFVPSDLGEIVVDLLVKHFADVMDVQFTAQMEEALDKIEEGELEWHRVLQDFYTPFSKDLELARVEMRNVRREAIPTDRICDVCGKPMVIKWGRFGKFLACTGFPECRYTQSLPTGFRCPEPDCNGDLVKRQSKKGSSFYGCSNYPKCTHISRRLPREGEKGHDGKSQIPQGTGPGPSSGEMKPPETV